MPSEELTPRELERIVQRQAMWVVLTAGALVWLIAVLSRKGIISWADVHAPAVADG